MPFFASGTMRNLKHVKKSNILLLLTSLFVTCLLMEIFFRYVFIQTNGIDVTLASQKWLQSYWKPINSLGFRDGEYTKDYLAGKHLIFIVGDSFAAGYGIKDIDKRFGNLIGSRLGNSFAVLNIAQRGWSTDDEIAALAAFPLKPDTVVLAYYLNDIEGAARKYGAYSSDVDGIYAAYNSPSLFHSLRRNSFLVDFLYWRLYPLTIEKNAGWWRWVRGVYDNKKIWEMHELELDELAFYCSSVNADMYVIIFPNLLDIPGSVAITDRIATFFAERNVKTLNLAPLLMNMKKSRLTVNSSDAHPSEFLHAFVAERMSSVIRKAHGLP